MASLRELQRSFAASLRDPGASSPVAPADNLAIYRNNAAINFRAALESSFPVIRRRVGADFFRQLAAHYRARHPSRSGDLRRIGSEFARFLDEHLACEYGWLADLARLEWACAEAAISAELPATGANVFAAFAPERLEDLVFTLQPSLQLVTSAYPVFSVWLANQSDNAPPVDQSLGSEAGMARIRDDRVEVTRLAPELFSYLSAVTDGATLGAAMTAANVDGPRLSEILGFVFSSNLVCSVTLDGIPRT